ncbi:MAG: AAA family ATPase, partial [Pseudomonadota bacterium]
LSLPVVLYALFSLFTLKTIAGSFRQSEMMERYLAKFRPTLDYLERRQGFFASLYTSHGTSFSKSIGRLKLCVSFLSIQSHGLAYIIVNGLMPWSMIFTGLAESWRRNYKTKFSSLLKGLKHLEVVCSSVIVTRYHTETSPSFHLNRIVSGEQIYHPMIPRREVVANSFKLDENQTVILLTGSNMSGKSTFMRAVAVNQILALAGFPVFAEKFVTTQARVVSCLQVKDNLDQGYSYFYSEVRKVKDILERSKSGQPLLFFIDEIFKGTNNRERFLGSKAVIQSLSQSSQAMGIVSTHDLELSELDNSSPSLKNFHFRDDVESDHLIFNYKIQPGPCLARRSRAA